jgi:magnesium transporter
LDYFDDYHFYIINAINPKTLKPEEIDLFCGEKFVVTFHYNPHKEIDEVWERMKNNPLPHSQAPGYIVYKIFDEIVDSFFPIAQKLEDRLTDLETKSMGHYSMEKRIDELFELRRQLLSLRHVVWPMRDLLYRMVNSHRLWNSEEERRHFLDIYDSLLKLSEMIESSREMTADIRDNYLSITSHRMNSIMMTLTIITTLFMPLTFIAGIYGMNFEYMPELKWKYGYFFILGVMAIVTIVMYYWFKRKGWINKE